MERGRLFGQFRGQSHIQPIRHSPGASGNTQQSEEVQRGGEERAHTLEEADREKNAV